MKKLLLAGFLLGGLIGSIAVGIVMKPCPDCHCQENGWCCCGGTCKPECNCIHCNCKKKAHDCP